MATRRLNIVLDLDTGGYSGRLATAGGQMRTFGGHVGNTSRSMQQMGGAFENLGRVMQTPTQRLRDYVLILGNIRLALLNVRDIAVGWVAGMVQQSAEVERLTVLMEGMSTATTAFGKNQDAHQNLAKLFDMARGSGFAMKELTDAFVKMKSAGLDPMNGSLKSLTNAVAYFGGNTDVMHRAAIAIQQMAGKGVVSMEELRQQLGEAVPTAMADMARGMGKSVQQFTKEVAKGKVEAGPALQALFKEFELKYAGAGKRMADTLNGQLAQFKTNVTSLSTYFTGLASGNTKEFEAYLQKQQQLLDAGKITIDQFQEATKPKSGLFAGVTDGMKELNALMQSNDAKMAMIELGRTISDMAQGLMSATRVAMEWGTQIGVAAKIALYSFAAIKASQIAQWFMKLGQAAAQSLTGAGVKATFIGKQLDAVSAAATKSANAYDRLANVQQVRVTRLQAEEAAAQRVAVATRAEMSAANQRVAIANQERILAQEEIATNNWRVTTLNQRVATIRMECDAIRQRQAANAAAIATAEQEALVGKDRIMAQFALNAELAKSILLENQLAAAEDRLAVASDHLSAAQGRVAGTHAAATAAGDAYRTAVNSQSVALAELVAAERAAASAASATATAQAAATRQISIASVVVGAGARVTAAWNSTTSRAGQFLSMLPSKAVNVAGAVKQMTVSLMSNTAALVTQGTTARNGTQSLSLMTRGMNLFRTAVTASTTATTLSATAMRVAATASAALGAAVNLALGPIGMIAMALYFAGQQAGFFETKASKAAAAADRLAQSIGNLQDVQAAQARVKQIDAELEENRDVNPLWGMTWHKGDSWHDTGINTRNNWQRAAERKRLMEERARLTRDIRTGAPKANQQAGQDDAQLHLDGYERFRQGQSAKYASDLRKAEKRGASPAELKKLGDKYRKETEATGADMIARAQDTRDKMIAKGGDPSRWNAFFDSIKNGVAPTNQASEAMSGMGKAAAAAGESASKSHKKMTEAQKEAKRAATEAENAREKYGNMLANQAGQIAQLEDQLNDGNGALAKFQAQLKAGKFAGALPGEIAKLAEGFAKIDQLTDNIAHKKTMDGLTADLKKATVQSDELWASLKNGSWERDQRTAQVKGQFAEITANEKDPQKLAEINGAMKRTTQVLNDRDAAEVAREWQQQTEQILNDLAVEDGAKATNYEREVERQRSLIDWANMSADKRMQAERMFNDYADAMRRKQERENESGIIKQMRGWTKLGANIKDALGNSLDSFIDGLGKGKLAFGDFAKNLVAELAKIVLRALIAYAILSALGIAPAGGFKSFMKGQTGGLLGGGSSGGGKAPSYELNSSAGQTIADNPGIFHTGGWFGSNPLKPGEVPIVGLDDEVALTQHQQRFYGRAFDAAVNGGGQPNVQVNVINNSGQQLSAQQSQPEFNGRDMIVNVVVEAMNKQGPMRDALQTMMSKK